MKKRQQFGYKEAMKSSDTLIWSILGILYDFDNCINMNVLINQEIKSTYTYMH